ncbi:hypothetical protein GOP47_0001983 [Adiantum capillus-veneris]|uniref:Uncharacterized protein n=1 Tax=Adiantum capillus-veneris TaxID=13818 RepID=A0A9D4ZR74_ADICA|nr:hypothetical protein GOP47_0001983 [Adiantum capillus-veneris]
MDAPADRLLHFVVVPFPMQGHTNPMLQLAQVLAGSAYGCLVTFVNTEYNQKLYEEREGRAVADQMSGRLRKVGLNDGLPLDAPRNSEEEMAKVIQSLPLHMKPQLERLLKQLNASPTPVSRIIADLFLPWLQSLVCSPAQPPLIGFSVTCVAQIATIYRLPHLVSSGQLCPLDGSLLNTTTTRLSVIPRLLAFEARNLPWCTGDPQGSVGLFQFVMNLQQQYMPQFRALRINSF